MRIRPFVGCGIGCLTPALAIGLTIAAVAGALCAVPARNLSHPPFTLRMRERRNHDH